MFSAVTAITTSVVKCALIELFFSFHLQFLHKNVLQVFNQDDCNEVLMQKKKKKEKKKYGLNSLYLDRQQKCKDCIITSVVRKMNSLYCKTSEKKCIKQSVLYNRITASLNINKTNLL